MNIITKRIGYCILVFIITFMLLPQNVLVASAATSATVYEYSSMLEAKGNIYYIQTVTGDKNSYDIYRLEVATGNKTRLVSSENDISSMMIHNDTLYYTSYEGEESFAQIYSVSIDAKEQKTICKGYSLCLDDSGIYYIKDKGEENKLYKRNYNSKKTTLIYTGNMSFNFVKKLDSTLYFTQFDKASSKLTLYTLLPGQTKLAVLTTDKITLNGSDRTPMVSDVVDFNGGIYYQYGTHEGSGNFWYGKLIKLDSSTNTKSVIQKMLFEEQIFHNNSNIFYDSRKDSINKHYQYNTKTGKTSVYTYNITGTESFDILGDKTYCAKADGKQMITVSCFTSGTNKNNMVESLIEITHKQKKKFSYCTYVKKYGDYLLIPVICMDFNANYGWRGRCVSITWYVAASDGKILAQF